MSDQPISQVNSPPTTMRRSTSGGRPDDLFMLIFTSGTSGDPKAVRCTHEKVAFPGLMLAHRFGLGPADTFYLSMPLFHSNAIMASWAVPSPRGSSIALRRKFSASGFFPTSPVQRHLRQLRRQTADLILATPARRTMPTTRSGSPTATRVRQGDLNRFAASSGSSSSTASAPSEGGVAIARAPDTRPALSPAGRRRPSSTSTPASRARRAWSAKWSTRPGADWFRGYYKKDDAAGPTPDAGRHLPPGDLAYRDETGFIYFAGRHGDWMRVDGRTSAPRPSSSILMRHPAVVRGGRGTRSRSGRRRSGDGGTGLPTAVFSADFHRFLCEQDDLG